MLTRVLILAALGTLSAAVCWHPDGLPAASFGYSLEHGPLTWAGLVPPPVWNACRLGQNQSPTVVYTGSTARVPPKLVDVAFSDADRATLENLGTTLEVPAESPHKNQRSLGGILAYDGRLFELKQFHFHTPSEHRINDEYYPLEMHMVFSTKNDAQLAVIGIMFQLVTRTLPKIELLPNVFLHLRNAIHPNTSVPTGALRMQGLQRAIKAGPLYAYNGSLTTPPCTEGVRWLVLGRPRALDVATYNAVKYVMKFNARYSQNAPGQINLLEMARQIADGPGLDKGTNLQGDPSNDTPFGHEDEPNSDGYLDDILGDSDSDSLSDLWVQS